MQSGLEELAATSPQDEGWAGLMGQLDEIFAKKTLAEWVNTLEEAGLGMAYSPVNSMAELAAGPPGPSQQLRHGHRPPYAGQDTRCGCSPGVFGNSRGQGGGGPGPGRA